MKKVYIIMLLHVILIMLASTEFEIVRFALKAKHFSWDFWVYSYRNGFGYRFHSHYTLPEVLTYIFAYATGLLLFAIVYNKGLRRTGSVGFGVCFLGLVSFLIEGSHWIFDHNLSWIASFPIVLIVLWFIIIASISKLNKHDSETEQAAEET